VYVSSEEEFEETKGYREALDPEICLSSLLTENGKKSLKIPKG
jgi:hypothetical protein